MPSSTTSSAHERPQRNTGSGEQPGARRRGHGAGRSWSPSSSPTTPTTACPSSPPTTSRPGCPTRRPWSKATRCGSAAPASASSSRWCRSEREDGSVAAELSLSLDKIAEPLPVNSTMIIRPKSPLGLKYVQIVPGDSDAGLRGRRNDPGLRLPARTGRHRRILRHVRREDPRRDPRNQAGFGNALAGRGPQLNAAFGSPARSWPKAASRRSRNLVAPSTDFGGFWRALEASQRHRRPGRREQRRPSSSPSTAPSPPSPASRGPTSRKRSRRARRPSTPRSKTCRRCDPSCTTPNASSPRFKPGAKALADTSPTIDAAERAGIPVLNASPAFNAQLEPTADALLAFQEAPGVFNGLDLLIDTNELLGPAIRFIAPAQTTCNYLTPRLPQRRQRLQRRQRPRQLAQRDRLPAAGRAQLRGRPGLGAGQRRQRHGVKIALNHLHSNPYPNTAAPGQPKECEAGNERYEVGVTSDRQRAAATTASRPPNSRKAAGGRKVMGRLPERDTRAGATKQRASSGARATPRSRWSSCSIFTIGPYLAFTGHVPFTSYGYELKATFANGVNISTNSPVRIAGVEVGRRDLGRTRRRRDHGHLHGRRQRPADPRRRLRRDPAADLPRGQLLHRPLTRAARARRSWAAATRSRSATPRPGPDRRDPDRAAVAGARRPRPPAGGLRHGAHPRCRPRPKTRPSCPRCRARPAAQALNGAFQYGGDAGRYSAQVTNALLGTSPHDLSRLVAGTGRTFGAFARHEEDLQGADRQLRRLHRRPRRPVGQPRSARSTASRRP